MKKPFLSFFILLITNISFSQKIISGFYESGLSLAYDSSLNIISGYFENYTGWDEEIKAPRFSCIFYIERTTLNNNILKINTYYPIDKKDDLITGTMEILNSRQVKILLPEDHGGCWNVQHFSEEPISFNLETPINWIQIRYVEKEKTWFYSDKNIRKKTKSYLIKGNPVCIEKIENNWAYCYYYGDKTSKGWLSLADLNNIQ